MYLELPFAISGAGEGEVRDFVARAAAVGL
jgi:hypothetical protein